MARTARTAPAAGRPCTTAAAAGTLLAFAVRKLANQGEEAAIRTVSGEPGPGS